MTRRLSSPLSRSAGSPGRRIVRLALAISLSSAVVLPGATLGLAITSNSAQASSAAAWDDFRADVARSCRAAAKPQLMDIQLQVDPFGSSHHGLALLRGTERGTLAANRQPVRVICIYDKQRHTAEIGSPLPAAYTPPVPPETAK